MALPADDTAADGGLELLHRLEKNADWAELHKQATALLETPAAADPAALAWISYFLGRAEAWRAQGASAISNYSLSAELFAEQGNLPMELRCQIGVARSHLDGNSLQLAIHLAEKVVGRASAAGLDYELHLAQMLVARAMSRGHNYPGSVEILRKAADFFEASGHSREFYTARQYLGWSLVGMGELDEGQRVAQENIEQLRSSGGDQGDVVNEINTLVFVAWCRGDFAAVLDLHEQLLELAAADSRPSTIMALYYNKALAEFAVKRYTDAKRSMHRAWDNARKEGDLRLLAPIQMALALIAIHEGQPESAVEYAELAQANIRDQQSDETALVNYYLTLAYLSAAMTGPAAVVWEDRQELAPSIENAQELDWLLAAMDAISTQPADSGDLDISLQAVLESIRADLISMRSVMPVRTGGAASHLC